VDIRPIRTDKDHRAALVEIEACWGAADGTEKGDKLDVLLALVEIYEAKRWPIEIDESFDPIDVLDYAIAELGHTQAELAGLLGSRSRASEILGRRRSLTVEMIHSISEAWKIPADLLVRPYKIERAA
jgi:antitoxin component HigA of HigAB toxin-antitoxin module